MSNPNTPQTSNPPLPTGITVTTHTSPGSMPSASPIPIPSSWTPMAGASSLFPKDSDSKLKGEINYLPWSILFWKAAATISCDGLLTGAMVKPDPSTHPNEYLVWYTMDLYITTLMLQCIQPSMFASINQMSAADAWNRLYIAYSPKGSGSIMTRFPSSTHLS